MRTKGSGRDVEKTGQEGDARNRARRSAPAERLWERSREERKETNSEAEYKNLEGRHEKSGRRERGNRRSESGGGEQGSRCEAELRENGKEEQKAE